MRRLIAIPLVCIGALALVTAAPARASGTLTVGMAISIGKHGCSLGFFGFNEDHDRLAVTAGHCADGVDWPVYSNNGVEIGIVVSHLPDNDDSRGIIRGARGYTLIQLYKSFDLDVFFTGLGSVTEGDWVTKYGKRSQKTTGKVTNVKYVTDRADLDLIASTVVQLPGDSGCPWYTKGPTLVGMGSSGDQESGGGNEGSQAQPIGSVVDLIRQNSPRWGKRFKVWLTD